MILCIQGIQLRARLLKVYCNIDIPLQPPEVYIVYNSITYTVHLRMIDLIIDEYRSFSHNIIQYILYVCISKLFTLVACSHELCSPGCSD